MSPETLSRRRIEPSRLLVTTTSRGIRRKNGTQIVWVFGHGTDMCATPTTSTDTGGPSTFATITRAGLSEIPAARMTMEMTTARTARRLLTDRLSIRARCRNRQNVLDAMYYIKQLLPDGNECECIAPELE